MFLIWMSPGQSIQQHVKPGLNKAAIVRRGEEKSLLRRGDCVLDKRQSSCSAAVAATSWSVSPFPTLECTLPLRVSEPEGNERLVPCFVEQLLQEMQPGEQTLLSHLIQGGFLFFFSSASLDFDLLCA